MTIATRFPKSWAVAGFDIKDSSLVLYLPLWYPYSDMAGGTIYSYDRNRIASTVTGATWERTGRLFNGSSDWILVPNSAPLQIDPAITYEMWVNQSALKVTAGLVGNNYDSSDYLHVHSNNGNLQWDIQFNLGAGQRLLNSYAAGLLANTWYHIVWTIVRTTTATITYYIDGIQVATQTTTDNPTSIALTTQFELGRRAVLNDRYLDGYMGEFRIYNRALSIGEILRNYQVSRWRYQ